MNQEFNIVNGPSRDTLIDAFKYAYSRDGIVSAKFEIALKPPANHLKIRSKDFIITEIQHEDGSGHSFNIGGFCKADMNPLVGIKTYKNYSFTAYYNAKTRKGLITLTK